jgi:biopolymer transport protein ExbD
MNIGGKGQKAEINVTPMIDVLLVMIINFMVITPLAPRGAGWGRIGLMTN